MAPLNVAGAPLSWQDMKPQLKEIRRRGVQQFVNLYHRVEHATGRELLWGDEIEYHLMKKSGKGATDPDRTVKISLRAPELLKHLQQCEGDDPRRYDGCSWHAEYGRWMVEATPREPFSGYATDLLRVERSMRLRRQRLLSCLSPDEIIPTVPSFPLMGVGHFTDPPAEPRGPVANSECIPDEVINPHPRFATLTRNIRERRGANVDIRMPLYQDVATPEFKDLPPGAPPPEVRGDAMAYGMGSCCLQVTFQARDIHESRYLTDQLAVLAPIMLALTAATPVFKGRLLDTDCRWDIVAQSVDDRTPAERRGPGEPVKEADRDPLLVGEGVRRLPKSRYGSISHYIYSCPAARKLNMHNPLDALSDLDVEVDGEAKAALLEAGVDEALARHIAFNFSRDPLVMYQERMGVDDDKETDHFETIQGSNWNTVRWKPPPAMNSEIGWRTEFRSMEVQLTDFENAAFTVFVMLATRAILAFDLDLLLPISKVDANMARAHRRGAVTGEKFFFRKHLVPPSVLEEAPCDGEESHGESANGGDHRRTICAPFDRDFEEMSLAEIFNGKGDYFPGLIPVCQAYIESIGMDATTTFEVNRYLKLIAMRASGRLLTNAAWARRFIAAHPDYLSDSVVAPTIAHDLMVASHEIGLGRRTCKEVLGEVTIEPIVPMDAWDIKLDGARSGRPEPGPRRARGSTHYACVCPSRGVYCCAAAKPVDRDKRNWLIAQYSRRTPFIQRIRSYAHTSDEGLRQEVLRVAGVTG